jgi:hypothetical protein
MRMTLLTVGGFAALLFVSACANGVGMFGKDDYVVTSATPDAVTLRFREGDLNKATARAQAHCSQTGRTAEMVNVSPAEGVSMGTFRCA